MKRLMAALVALSLPIGALGQTQLAPGARVRVRTSDTKETLVGTLSALHEGVLHLADARSDGAGASARRVALASVDRIEVSRGSKRRSGLFALIGAAGGVVWALAICKDNRCSGSFEPETSRVVFGLGIAGAGVGALVGLAVRHEAWEAVPKKNLSVAIGAVRGGGLAGAITVRF